MPCYHPLPVWVSSELTDKGKYGISFRPLTGVNERRTMEVPCGTCIGCRLDFANKWAVRCVHEAKCWSENYFVTLTYKDVPAGGSLDPSHFVEFMKRLRIDQERKFNHVGVRFLQCGEYGERLQRPHHHALLFNVHLPDVVLPQGESRAVSDSKYLSALWGFGFCGVGTVTGASAGYIARYASNKSVKTEEWLKGRHREYMTMSRRPGIGRLWADKYLREWISHDAVMVDGSERKLPRYYDDLARAEFPGLYAEAKRKRIEAAVASPDNTGSRLVVREVVKQAAISSLTRPLED